MKFLILLFLLIFQFCDPHTPKPHVSKHKPSLFVALNSFFRFKQSPLSIINTVASPKVTLSSNEDIGSGPIYKKGWLKYLSFTSKSSKIFSEFIKNSAYFDQNQQNSMNSANSINSINQRDSSTIPKDECGSIEVPDPYHFFFYLTYDNLYIVSARKNALAKTFRVLGLRTADMRTNVKSEFVLGVDDQGNYQEGYCFKLRVQNCGLSEFIILCADNLLDKIDWMKKISTLKLRCQTENPHIINEAVIGANIRGNTEFQSNYTENIIYKSQKIDGKWIILHDWSTCTLACGGGTQTLHRLCIPPTEGGTPCDGQPIITRSCNVQPCPNVRVVVDEKVAPTKIKMLRISKRPQRYEVIKKLLFLSKIMQKII